MKHWNLEYHAMVITASLVVQYLLGMAVNMFVTFPESGNAGVFWEIMWSHTVSASHITLGILLLIGSFMFMIRAIMQRNKVWSIAGLIGFLAILAAGLSGAAFVSTQNDWYSFSMATSFIVTLCAYFIGFTSNKKKS